jgi:hypothetical protein
VIGVEPSVLEMSSLVGGPKCDQRGTSWLRFM